MPVPACRVQTVTSVTCQGNEYCDHGMGGIVRTPTRLDPVEQAFDCTPERVIDGVQTMFKLRGAMLVLLANPLPGHHPGLHGGPTFQWDPAADRPVRRPTRTGASQ